MSTLLVRARLLGADDISFGRNSIVYVNYLGITKTIAQFNASHLPLKSQNFTVDNLFDQSYGPIIYPASVVSTGALTGTDLTASGDLVVSGAASVNTLQVPSMNVAGYVTNDASGNLSGGSAFTVNIASIPSDAITGAAAYGTSATGTDTYRITLSPALASYKTGQLIAFKPDTSNTGACSLSVNLIGDVAIKVYWAGSQYDPNDGDIQAGCISYVVYDSTAPAWILLNPAGRRSIIYASGTSGTWTCPVGVTKVYATGCGGGGGGAGGTTGIGGTAALAVTRLVLPVTPSTGYNFVVGAGGAGGGAGSPGSDGHDTTFGALLTLTKGTGGIAAGGPTAGGTNALGLGGATGVSGIAGLGSGSGGGGASGPAGVGGAGAGGLLWLEW